MNKIVAIMIILMSFIAIVGVLVTIDDGMEIEEGYWSKVEYTDSLLVGYPDYYPLVIKLSSLGSLPSDLQTEVNYTDTIKIAYYNIQFNMSELRDVDRERSSDEWIGVKKPLELEFEIDKEMAEGLDGLEIIIEMRPHNFTNILNNDIFVLEVDFRREGTGVDVMSAFAITLLPLLFVYLNIRLYHHINSKFVKNLFWSDIPYYYLKYFVSLFLSFFLIRWIIHIPSKIKKEMKIRKYRKLKEKIKEKNSSMGDENINKDNK